MPNTPLIIVESPSKARTIERYLGGEYRVLACNGHVKDLPKKNLGVDITNNFAVEYEILSEKKDIVKKLKKSAANAPSIYIATDPDREGEAIAWHVASELNGKSGKVHRVLFNEITADGIRTGMDSPREVNHDLVNAQQARRIIDRIVGFKVSEFLWKVLYSGLSAGRVQSVALRLVCERHEEIINFKPEEYWILEVELMTKGGETFTARLHKVDGENIELKNEVAINEIISKLENESFIVDSIKKKEVRRKPYAPFITSTIQQDAATRLKYSPARTMRLAQRLYEGVEMESGEPTGLITYMRTDSTRLAPAAVDGARQFISSQYGEQYLPEKNNVYGQQKKNIQDAHEAIRPTDPNRTPEMVKGHLENDEFKLYDLIWRRFIACQMNPSILDQTTIEIKAGDAQFRVSGSVVKFDGFRKAYPALEKKENPLLPSDISENEKLDRKQFLPEQHFTKPPPYYTESSLIKELDKQGIGRPSTFAETLSRLQKRQYATKDRQKLIPTEAGLTVNKVLIENLPDIFNTGFTARMEEELDEIESGDQDYIEVLHDFYKPFHSSMESVEERRKEIKKSLMEETEESCEKCGSPMVIKWNRRGEKFVACSGFPECRNAKSLHDDAEPETIEKPCPKCGSTLQVKRGRFGRYIGCEKYPDCRHTESISTGIACPRDDCEGEMVEKSSRKGKIFFGCSRYPDCDHASWYKPILQPCEACENHYIEERVNKTKGKFYLCPECKTEAEFVEEAEV
ncbi:MAG TPA: type I DNA topoisomerase [Candidatus Marinimicrobia bacterium]|nr:type I DNA topoisomerase [Candidatus Neomarinimicrobiota bacterium]